VVTAVVLRRKLYVVHTQHTHTHWGLMVYVCVCVCVCEWDQSRDKLRITLAGPTTQFQNQYTTEKKRVHGTRKFWIR
jgi:hypothetical protein